MAFPEAITGGCLCGSIRYSISASTETPWPPQSSTCQCTMCRKWTSSLIAQFIIVLPSQIEPAFGSHETFAEYESSPGRYRGFCKRCGTSLVWRSTDDGSTVDVFLGTVDEKWLVHEDGGKVGQALARPNGTQFWMENAVPGVTDLVKGGKEFPREGEDGWERKKE
ncbi:hypothetical protein BBK36DRAFT_1138017 [Trichoderma citrinoviride]|uniref:CENP-V/GFA domain-containing protein n=1 Tax=Trichoderma citrinoviride TaxID=58853 RepID=A0A2T4BJV6_9HYPO|nr:hypothetical protein BBK36DRAFT_1138017 [Trichoderma citrinoviride]PTB69593.1 hypothetical protein BBK36DRAFT_1138017 [Trichoderma citrinoviride]